MEYRVLGPLEVLEDGSPLALGNLKERMVLGVLLLHANEFVSRERLIDELWGVAPPATARKAVNVYVSKLRKTLSANGADPIATADGGYRLSVDLDRLDSERARTLVTSAREHAEAGDAAAASRLLQEALALWRGSTLAGLPLESFGRDEVAELDELRLTALMDRIDCELALGRHEQVLGELNVLVREPPLRERFRAQQMLALYRADRQADALAAYGEARQALTDDLGIEPSEALQRLQQAILRHDASLEVPAGTTEMNGDAAPTSPPLARTAERDETVAPVRGHLRRPRRWQLAGAVLVAVATSVVAAVTLSRSAAATPRAFPNSLVRIDPRLGRIVSVVPFGNDPGSIAITPDAVWAVNTGNHTVSRYDLRTHRVQSSDPFLVEPYDIVADTAGNVWVSGNASDVTRLAVRGAGDSKRRVHIWTASTLSTPPPGAGSLALGGGHLWVVPGPLTLPGDNRAFLFNLATGRPVRTLRVRGDTTGIAFGAGAAWVSTSYRGDGLLYGIPAGTGRPRSYRVELGDSTFGISYGEGGVWLLTWGTNGGVGPGSVQQVLEVDPRTGHVGPRRTFDGQDLWAIAAGGGSVWVLADASVIQIDPRSGHVVRTIPLHPRDHAPTCGIAAADDAVWVTMGRGNCGTGSA